MEDITINPYIEVSSFSLENSWKYAEKKWGHSLHRMCSRTGSFPPSLARYFIEKYSVEGNVVLDPFSGKGTAPLEACLSGRIGIGNDISPEAYVLTYSKVKPVPFEGIRNYIERIREKMDSETVNLSEIKEEVRLFFHPFTLKQIVSLQGITKLDASDETIFTKALMCGIIHGNSRAALSLPCSHSFSMSPAYVRQYAKNHKLKRPKKDVIECLQIKAASVLNDEPLRKRGCAYNTDATQLPLEDESIDLILTSPPYFNKQTYAKDNWLRLWFLGYDYREVRKKLFQTGSKERFSEFMKKSMEEMYRVLRNNSACFIVVGDVMINRKLTNTAILLADLADSIGFEVHRIIKDSIPKNGKYFMFIPRDKGIRTDRIVELHKGKPIERRVGLPWHK